MKFSKLFKTFVLIAIFTVLLSAFSLFETNESWASVHFLDNVPANQRGDIQIFLERQTDPIISDWAYANDTAVTNLIVRRGWHTSNSDNQLHLTVRVPDGHDPDSATAHVYRTGEASIYPKESPQAGHDEL